MLPGPGVVQLIPFERIDTGHQEPALTVRPQAHIDLVEPSRCRMHREQMHDSLSQHQKEHAVVQRSFARGLLKLAVRVVQKYQIEIGSVAEFQSAEFAVARHRHLDDSRARRVIPAIRHAVDLGHLAPGEVHAALHDELGDVGQPVADPHQRETTREVGEGHRKYRNLLELAQRFDLPLRIVRGQPFGPGGEFPGKSLARRHFGERSGIDQFVEQQRKVGDLTRQEPADGTYVDQPIESRRLLLEERQIGRAGADRIEHAQHSLHHDGGVRLRGSLYIADTGNNVVRKVSPDGTIRTVAGTGTRGYLGDGGAALNAWLNAPEAVAVDAEENLYIADTFNGRIRRVGTDGVIGTVAGVGSTGIYSGDGGPARNADISLPTDVALDGAGTLYLADFGNTRVRMVSGGIITTVAGQTNGAPLTEGQAAVNARLEGPTGVTVDSGGSIYFVEAGIGSGTGLAVGDYKVWKVSTAGIIGTLAGNGIPNYSGEGVAPTVAQLNGPAGVAVSRFGVIYISDTQNQRVRATSTAGGYALVTLAGNGTPGFNGEIILPRDAQLNRPVGVAA